MVNIKLYWEKLSQYEKTLILQKWHFWDGLRDFPYKWIPKELKIVLSHEMEENKPLRLKKPG